MLYGANVWDPLLIIAQIISIQCLYYLSMGLWLAVFIAPYKGRLSIAYVFDWHLMSFKHFTGWMLIVANLANSPVVAVSLLWLVERAKKCLDYGSTCYLLHFFITWGVQGFPVSVAWWVTNASCMLVACLLGEWLCVRREMADIPLSTLRANKAATSSNGGSSSPKGAEPGTSTFHAATPAPATVTTVAPRPTATSKLASLITARGSHGGSRLANSSSNNTRINPANRVLSVQMTDARSEREGRLSRSNSRSRLLGDEAV